MDLFVFGGASGSFLVHLPQIFPRFYGTEIYDTDHSGDDPEFPAPFPGHQDSSPGYILRHMDRDRRSRSSVRRNAAVQRSLDTSEAVSYTHLDVYKRQAVKSAFHIIGRHCIHMT